MDPKNIFSDEFLRNLQNEDHYMNDLGSSENDIVIGLRESKIKTRRPS